ncbi:HPr kinase/phosphorylase [Falsiroseomonas ponticola]|jgi:HPr kinase/phosphorylase|uniref:HPr kinase/phosphorylase n=1 Tax=Falsiroseomonas ponticola TaxID=2786951 RepID=UPI0019320450|nr:HPr kinase/phosphatase C-terminal domain-containing protein [Roseomonas ponticola]
MPLHGSCVALDDDGVLILGPSGAGKSDLVLRLLGRGWHLVADDQVEVAARQGALIASSPGPLRGMLEIRGLGLMRDLPAAASARLRLAVQLRDTPPPRLPDPARWTAHDIDLPLVALRGKEPSAPDKLAFALKAACGRAAMAAGAFAP